MQTGKWMAGLAMAAFCAVGCEESKYEEYSKAPLSVPQAHDHDHDHDHDHGGHEGKHGGHVLELDDTHGYHAELVFDSATRDITLYFYGSEIGVAKNVTDLEFEIEMGGAEAELESKASPLEGETEETCSRFVISGTQLPAGVKSEEQVDAHFHVTIDGKEFVKELKPHSHDEHAEHAHEGEKAGSEKSGEATHDEEKPADEKTGEADHSEEKASDTAAPADATTPPAADAAPKAE